MQTTMKKEVPSKEYVYEQLRSISMSSSAQTVILTMVDSAWFDYCIIVKQLMTALDFSKTVVEKSLTELIDIGLVKQQALFGSERTYIINAHYFSNKRPQRRSREELKSLLTVHITKT